MAIVVKTVFTIVNFSKMHTVRTVRVIAEYSDKLACIHINLKVTNVKMLMV